MKNDIVIKNLSQSNNSWEFLDGSSRTAENLRSSYIGLGTYQPGWRWSEHVGKQTGKPSANHIGYVISGSFIVQSPDGDEKVVGPGEAFELPPGSDAWVKGEETCIALDFGCNQNHDNS